MILEKHKEMINYLLYIEHQSIAIKLKLIEENALLISDEELYEAIGIIDHYSRYPDDKSKQIVIVLSSILYTYKQSHWSGLSQFLIIVLSRIGFAPSAIMVDEDYDWRSDTFSSLESFISQISTTINQLKNEIKIKNKIYLLTDFQKDVWEKSFVSKFLGISAPTSAGKSFVILLKCIENIINKGGNIVYIVPTLSLINQVVKDFHIKLKEYEIDNYEILTNWNKDRNNNIIYVLTPERAISAYSENDIPFGNINSFIVDEIQNIERIENKDDERSKILFDSLVELSFSNKPELIIFSGPHVSGLQDMGFDIFQESNSSSISAISSPVTNFTYSILKQGNKYYLKQYSQIIEKYSSIEIKNTEYLKIGGKQYDDKYLSYLNVFVNTLESGSKNIIFSPTSNIARKIAVNLSIKNKIVNSRNDYMIKSLIKYVSETVHPNYDLCKTLNDNVAYHHGKVPSHISNALEYAIKERMIDNVVCTTTLMQGVNLPAQNVIMRNGYLSTKNIKGVMPQLTNYEISNLRGRAGRLLKDFIGRTFILDENAFDNSSEKQGDLFKDENKDLQTGYGKIFTENKSKITDAVYKNKNNEELGNEIGNDSKFLITYIRFNILKHGLDCVQRLNSVGVDYSIKEIELIENKLINELEVPIEICLKNRYVDPLIINDIYKNISSYRIPMDINDNNLANSLYKLVDLIRKNYPNYYNKYFNRDLSEPFFYTVIDWMKEKSLSRILNNKYFNDSDNIDKKIDDIQKAICFDLTSMLKPFYSIRNKDSNILSCMEMGGYKPVTLQLMSLNIPREVALILCNTIFSGLNLKDKNINDVLIKEVIKSNIANIDFWNKIQLEHLL